MAFAQGARWSLLGAVGLTAALAGCGGPGPGESLGENESPITPDLFPNDKTAFDYFLGKGLKNYQAAGIVGNLDQESGVDPTAVQSGGPGRGIAQWSVGGRWDTDANDNATWYASKQGQNLLSLQLQLDFIWYELTTFSGYGLSALQASTDVTGATIAFQNDFEGCGTCNEQQRIAYAQGVLAAYGNDQVDGGPPADAGGDGPSGPPCVVGTTGKSGVCISTTECAAMPGYTSTPGYCPGPANIQCCTGPDTDGGTTGQPEGGDAGSSDGGAPPPGDSGVGAPQEGGAQPDAGVEPDAIAGPGADGGGASLAGCQRKRP
jgi:hypothetical protein